MLTIEAPALVVLRKQIDARWPQRSLLADGIFGADGGHATGNAIDISYDPVSGPNLDALAEALLHDPRVILATWRGRCAEPRLHGRVWRRVSGSDEQHAAHLHLAIDPRRRDDETVWALEVAPGDGASLQAGEPTVRLGPAGLRLGDFVLRPSVATATDATHDSQQNEARALAREEDRRAAQRSVDGGAAPAWSVGPRGRAPRASLEAVPREAAEIPVQLRDPLTGKPLGRLDGELPRSDTGRGGWRGGGSRAGGGGWAWWSLPGEPDDEAGEVLEEIQAAAERARSKQREYLKGTWLRDTWLGSFLNLDKDDKPAVKVDPGWEEYEAPSGPAPAAAPNRRTGPHQPAPSDVFSGARPRGTRAVPAGALDPNQLQMGGRSPRTPAAPAGPLDPGLLRIGDASGMPKDTGANAASEPTEPDEEDNWLGLGPLPAPGETGEIQPWDSFLPPSPKEETE